MAYGNLKAEKLIYDNNGTDEEISLSTIGGKADVDGQTFTGNVVLPTTTTGTTQSAGDNSTKLATTAYADSAGGSDPTKANLTGDTFTGGINLADGIKLTLGDGAGNDYNPGSFEIYESGGLYIKSNGGHIRNNIPAGQSVLLEGPTGSMAKFGEGGACELYYDDVKKIETTTDGVNITGKVDTDGIDNANQYNIKPGGEFFHFENNSAWHLVFDKTAGYTGGGVNWTYGIDVSKSYVRLYGGEAGSSKDATVVLETKTTGIDVTGNLDVTGELTSTTVVTGELTSTTAFQPFVAATTTVTATANTKYTIDTSSSAFTLTLPASPTVGQYVTLVDIKGSWATNNLTVAQNGKNIQGAAADLVCNVNHAHVTLIFSADATTGWVVT